VHNDKVHRHDSSQQHQDVEVDGIDEVYVVGGEEDHSREVAGGGPEYGARAPVQRDERVDGEEEGERDACEDDHCHQAVRQRGHLVTGARLLEGANSVVHVLSFLLEND
jgi:hypothetical protein